MEEVITHLERDFTDFIEELTIELQAEIKDDMKLGYRKITLEEKEQLVKCAFTWVVQELSYNDALTKTQVQGFLVEYDLLKENDLISPYGFDEETEVYAFDFGEYYDYWQN